MNRGYRLNPWLVILMAVTLGVVLVTMMARGGTNRGEHDTVVGEATAVDSSPLTDMAVLEAAQPRVEVGAQPSVIETTLDPVELPSKPDFHFPPYFEERPLVPDNVFEAMYGSMTVEELTAQKAMLSLEYTREMDRVSQERYDAGLYEEYIVDTPQDPEEELALPPWPYHKGLSRGQRTNSLPNGKVQVWRTVIPYDEYPGYYAKKDELNWLIQQISSFNKQG